MLYLWQFLLRARRVQSPSWWGSLIGHLITTHPSQNVGWHAASLAVTDDIEKSSRFLASVLVVVNFEIKRPSVSGRDQQNMVSQSFHHALHHSLDHARVALVGVRPFDF